MTKVLTQEKYSVPGLFQKDFCVIIMYVYCAYKLHDLVTFPSMQLSIGWSTKYSRLTDKYLFKEQIKQFRNY